MQAFPALVLLAAAAFWWALSSTILCFDPLVPCTSSVPPPDTDEGGFTLITGCSSGIGRELALLYAKRGARLILAARRKPLLEQLSGLTLTRTLTLALTLTLTRTLSPTLTLALTRIILTT